MTGNFHYMTGNFHFMMGSFHFMMGSFHYMKGKLPFVRGTLPARMGDSQMRREIVVIPRRDGAVAAGGFHRCVVRGHWNPRGAALRVCKGRATV